MAKIEAMLTVATETEARREKAAHLATVMAVRDLFSGGVSKKYLAALDKVIEELRKETANQEPSMDTKAAEKKKAAQAIIEGFAKMGIIPRAKKSGRKK